ncbi:hypothetical protein RGUI_1851 [Rhodovulum sp. P5]|uniref:hypothetical protein n=1 Tax=Rhodovulum sp. P5 TaxID=1564506 RepID=UPI0009C34400|nr:hypothetical protein [Rhodovulum sp. P5]ARE39992.1 hypothetical protein RGUI_1851 [Rhodovulum sp. P5]
MNKIGCTVLFAAAMQVQSAPAATIFTDRTAFMAALSALSDVSIVTEGFESDAVWGPSRNSIVSPGSAPSITSQGLTWRSNLAGGEIATGTGPAVFGSYGFYALPHGNTSDSRNVNCDAFPDDPPADSVCWQNDGWLISSESGESLYAFGGWVVSNTGGGAKITFLLDGADVSAELPDNPDNVQRDGIPLVPYAQPIFVGVIEEAGFGTVEVRELSGQDNHAQYIFGDQFTIAVDRANTPPTSRCRQAGFWC